MMINLQKVAELVRQAYESAGQDFGRWMWANHVPLVARQAQELSDRFGADAELAVAGAWLHDLGDAFVHRHDKKHEEVSDREARLILSESGYSEDEVELVLREVIAPHSCRDGFLPTTLEGKVMATADALAHFKTDFYVQLTWRHLPDDYDYEQHRQWVLGKLERDFESKIFFDEVREEVRGRYEALREVYGGKI